ncbi:hypothetical protein Anapl_01069 [Anas platyrhynchos]|uniref:Uncharacterized protein n=1 Tax=Anas platyrhynchos TaxID=8839 RepID=R0M255_ANAPL|nr:hypothetical protein Anapl_01069 [Anas platyrhynchos]
MGGAPAARGADGGSAETAEAARRLQHSEGTSKVQGVESGAGGCLTPAPGHFIGSSKCSASFRVVAGAARAFHLPTRNSPPASSSHPQLLACAHVHAENPISPSSFPIPFVVLAVRTLSCVLCSQQPSSVPPCHDRQPSTAPVPKPLASQKHPFGAYPPEETRSLCKPSPPDTQPRGPHGNPWRLEEVVGRAFAPGDVQQKGFVGAVLGAFLCQGSALLPGKTAQSI